MRHYICRWSLLSGINATGGKIFQTLIHATGGLALLIHRSVWSTRYAILLLSRSWHLSFYFVQFLVRPTDHVVMKHRLFSASIHTGIGAYLYVIRKTRGRSQPGCRCRSVNKITMCLYGLTRPRFNMDFWHKLFQTFSGIFM